MKLADVGVAKHEKEITGTMVGTSLYLAPEVHEGRIYNSKADMYSFGFVLWELWYGEPAFQTAITIRESHRDLLEDVRQGRRPTHIEGTQPPPEGWQHVMTECWNKEPRSRMTAKEGLEYLKQLQEDQSQRRKPPPPPPPTRSLTPRPLSRRKKPPPTKPKPAPRRKKPEETLQVSYCHKTEEGTVHFESNE